MENKDYDPYLLATLKFSKERLRKMCGEILEHLDSLSQDIDNPESLKLSLLIKAKTASLPRLAKEIAHLSKGENLVKKYIPIDSCKHGHTYRINSRNLSFGVYDKDKKGFVGIRYKFGERYLFTEYHWDTGAPFGTVCPQKELEECPIKDLSETFKDEERGVLILNQELFDYLDTFKVTEDDPY